MNYYLDGQNDGLTSSNLTIQSDNDRTNFFLPPVMTMSKSPGSSHLAKGMSVRSQRDKVM